MGCSRDSPLRAQAPLLSVCEDSSAAPSSVTWGLDHEHSESRRSRSPG